MPDTRESYKCHVCEREIRMRFPDGSLAVANRVANQGTGRMVEMCPNCHIEWIMWTVDLFKKNRDPLGVEHHFPDV